MGIKRRNPLAIYINDDVNSFFNMMKHKILEWLVQVSNHNVKIETFDKQLISIKGIEYSGTLEVLYWSYFDPFLKDYISKISEKVRKDACEAKVDVIDTLKIFHNCMSNTVKELYKEISKTDQLMRLKGMYNNLPEKHINPKIENMICFLNEKVNAQIKIVHRQKWYNWKLSLLKLLWSLIMFFMGLLCEKIEWENLKFYFDKIYEKL